MVESLVFVSLVVCLCLGFVCVLGFIKKVIIFCPIVSSLVKICSGSQRLSSFQMRSSESDENHPYGYNKSLDRLSEKAVYSSDVCERCTTVQDLFNDRSFDEGNPNLIQFYVFVNLDFICRCRMAFY